jgi:hypothetical protein
MQLPLAATPLANSHIATCELVLERAQIVRRTMGRATIRVFNSSEVTETSVAVNVVLALGSYIVWAQDNRVALQNSLQNALEEESALI